MNSFLDPSETKNNKTAQDESIQYNDDALFIDKSKHQKYRL
jgi:hypothetical protein